MKCDRVFSIIDYQEQLFHFCVAASSAHRRDILELAYTMCKIHQWIQLLQFLIKISNSRARCSFTVHTGRIPRTRKAKPIPTLIRKPCFWFNNFFEKNYIYIIIMVFDICSVAAKNASERRAEAKWIPDWSSPSSF